MQMEDVEEEEAEGLDCRIVFDVEISEVGPLGLDLVDFRDELLLVYWRILCN